MATPKESIRLGAALREAVGIRAEKLGYKSWSDYVRGLMRYDLMVQGGHDVTLPIAGLDATTQDKLDGELLKLTKRGEGRRGQLFTRLIEKVTNDGAEANGQTVADKIREITSGAP